jgi:hypothetical protein
MQDSAPFTDPFAGGLPMRPIHFLALAAFALATCAGASTHSTTQTSRSGDGFHYGSWSDDSDGSRDSFQWAIVEPGAHESMSASDRDSWNTVSRVQDEAKRLGQPLFWFRMNGRSYLVRDRELTERATRIVAPMQEIGAKQGRIGAQQGKWGGLQGKLGALQGRIGAMQARIAVASMNASSDQDRRDLADLKNQVRDLGDQARELGEEQRTLGDRQRTLGAQQGELGRQQAAASKIAIHDLKGLAKDALGSGHAENF